MLYLVFAFLGFGVGVLSGCFGVGGAFVLTPTLNALGFPMTTAVGTGLAFTVGVSFFGGIQHLRNGTIPRKMLYKLVIPVSLVSLVSLTMAKSLALKLELANSAGFYIRLAYIVLLFIAGFMVMHKRRRSCVKERNTLSELPPLLDIGLENGKVSLWSVLFIGLFVGFLKGFMGVGGGFMLVPLFLALCGVNSHMAVGASLLVLMISSVYGGGLYLAAGKVEIIPTVIMVAGSWLGSTIGVKGHCNFCEEALRNSLGIFLLLCAVGVILRSLGWQKISMIYMIGLCLGAATYIILKGSMPLGKQLPEVGEGK